MTYQPKKQQPVVDGPTEPNTETPAGPTDPPSHTDAKPPNKKQQKKKQYMNLSPIPSIDKMSSTVNPLSAGDLIGLDNNVVDQKVKLVKQQKEIIKVGEELAEGHAEVSQMIVDEENLGGRYDTPARPTKQSQREPLHMPTRPSQVNTNDSMKAIRTKKPKVNN